MITLFLSFFLSLLNPTPLARVPEMPSVNVPSAGPSDTLREGTCALRLSAPEPPVFDPGGGFRMEPGATYGEAGDGWDHARRGAMSYAPDSSLETESADTHS